MPVYAFSRQPCTANIIDFSGVTRRQSDVRSKCFTTRWRNRCTCSTRGSRWQTSATAPGTSWPRCTALSHVTAASSCHDNRCDVIAGVAQRAWVSYALRGEGWTEERYSPASPLVKLPWQRLWRHKRLCWWRHRWRRRVGYAPPGRELGDFRADFGGQCDNYNLKWYRRCNNIVSYEFIWIRRTCDYI